MPTAQTLAAKMKIGWNLGNSAVSASLSLGASLGTGEYIVKVFGAAGTQTFKLIKNSK